jgi:hypothetical protein
MKKRNDEERTPNAARSRAPATPIKPRRAVKLEKVMVTRLGLQLPRSLTYDDWEQAGYKLAAIIDSSCWCLGDWVVYGESAYVDRYRLAIDAVGLDYQTLRNYAWTARSFEASRRRAALSFQHHAEVASLDVSDQDRWLDLAEEHGWSRNRLRQAVREERLQAKGDHESSGEIIPRVNATKDQVNRWLAAAERSGDSFEQWIAASLDRAASQVLEPEEPGPAAVLGTSV